MPDNKFLMTRKRSLILPKLEMFLFRFIPWIFFRPEDKQPLKDMHDEENEKEKEAHDEKMPMIK